MNKHIKSIILSIFIFCFVVCLYFVDSILPSYSEPNNEFKPQIYEISSLFDKGLQNLDVDVRYTTLIHTDEVEVELKSLNGFPKHYHKSESHFIYVLRGQGNLTVGNSKYIIKSGDFIAIPAGKKYEHELKGIGNKPLELLVLGVPPEK